MRFSNERREYHKRIGTLRSALQAAIAELPDNPNITRLAPNCFTTSLAHLGTNWTPEHYDFTMRDESAPKNRWLEVWEFELHTHA